MRGGSSIFEPSTGPKVLFVPRRPVPKGLGENAFFCAFTAHPSLSPPNLEGHVLSNVLTVFLPNTGVMDRNIFGNLEDTTRS